MKIAGENPFGDAKAEAGETDAGGRSEEARPEAEEPAPESPADALFGEDDGDGDEDALPGESDSLFDEESEDREEPESGAEAKGDDDEKEEPPRYRKGKPPMAHRIGKLKGHLREAQGDLERVRSEAEEYKPLALAVRSVYGKREDPIRALEEDASFMDVMEQHKAVPEVARCIAWVINKLKGGPVAEKKPATEKQSDSAGVDRILRRDAKRTIDETLSKHAVKPYFKRQIAAEILGDAKLDLEGLDADEVVRRARAYFRENEIPAADAVERKATTKAAAEESQKKEAPAAGGSARAAVGEKKAEKAKGDGEQRQRPKDLTAWEDSHSERMRAFLAEQPAA